MLQLFVSSDTDFATTVLHDNATVTMQPMACNFGSAGIRFYWHQPQPRLNIYAAFDKGDLLYLRDEEEKRRFTEMELRDSEQQQFRKERARIEAERAAAALRAAQARKDKQGRYKQRRTALHLWCQISSCGSFAPLLAGRVSLAWAPVILAPWSFLISPVMQSVNKIQR